MSEPSKIRWLNAVGVLAAAAILCALPLDALRPREPSLNGFAADAARVFGGWLALMLIGMIPGSIAAVVSRRRGSADPTKTGIHVGLIAIAVATFLSALGTLHS